VTRDNALLAEYYALRENRYREELGLENFDGSEEEQDRRGKILLAIFEGKCIGGARITSEVSLPSQIEHLALNTDTCCMWERFVMDPRVRTISMVRDFCAALITASTESGYEHAMVLSSLRNARFYRRCHATLGVDFHIHRHVPHSAGGAFAGLEHYLSTSALTQEARLQIAV